MSKFKKGQTPWNKGLPKEQQPCFNKKTALGYKHTEESKNKISSSLKKQWDDGTRTYEHLHTEESNIKRIKSMIGREVSESTRKKISEAQQGEKNHAWNPNRDSMRKFQRNDGAYRDWRYAVRRRDRNKCQLEDEYCSDKMITHHIVPWRANKDLRYEVDNGITLCTKHHPLKKAEEIDMIETFKNIINNKKLLCNL